MNPPISDRKWKRFALAALAVVVLLMCVSWQVYVERGAPNRLEFAPLRPPRPPPGTIFYAVDKVLKTLPIGAMAFNTPPPMNIDGPAAEVELRVSLKESLSELAKSITVPGEVQVHEVQIANRMQASLYVDPDGLTVTPLTPPLQAVSGELDTIWIWSIKPLKVGRQPVHIEVEAEVNIDGTVTPRLIRVFNGSIAVTITPRQRVERFIKANWQWLWTALLVPVGGWWWKRKAKKDEIDVS